MNIRNFTSTGLLAAALLGPSTVAAQIASQLSLYGGFSSPDLESDTAGVDAGASGPVVGLEGKLFIEGRAFAYGGAETTNTDGDDGGTDYDLNFDFYRVGLGLENPIGDGNLYANVRAGFVRLKSDLRIAGFGAASDGQNGGSVALRAGRVPTLSRFSPFLDIEQMFLDDVDVTQIVLGTEYGLAPTLGLTPYGDVRYRNYRLDNAGDADLTEVTVTIGLIWRP